MNDEARAELIAGLIRLAFTLAAMGIGVAVTSMAFRDQLRAWWYRGVELVAEPAPPEPTNAEVADMMRRVREIQVQGRDWE